VTKISRYGTAGISLRTLPPVFRALFSCFLIVIGLGYLMALTLLFLVDVRPHERQGMNLVEAIDATYHGQPKVSELEAALKGPMATMLSERQRSRILSWIHNGGRSGDYGQVASIFRKQCISCHSPQSGIPIPPLTNYKSVHKLLGTDVGLATAQLARVSHVHLFGISIIFLLTGAIFALSDLPIGTRVLLVSIPYLSIVLDIGSWWGTKYLDPTFAYIVIAGGILMGGALAAQIFVSLWQMWALSLKRALEPMWGNHGGALHHPG